VGSCGGGGDIPQAPSALWWTAGSALPGRFHAITRRLQTINASKGLGPAAPPCSTTCSPPHHSPCNPPIQLTDIARHSPQQQQQTAALFCPAVASPPPPSLCFALLTISSSLTAVRAHSSPTRTASSRSVSSSLRSSVSLDTEGASGPAVHRVRQVLRPVGDEGTSGAQGLACIPLMAVMCTGVAR
jgi:hypothetical protein